MEIRKIIGIVFSLVSLITFGIFIAQTEFTNQLHSWISFKYYIQFAPYFISIMLFCSGFYLIKKNPRSNFAMAIFGYTIFEIIALEWMGILSNNLNTFTTVLFVSCAVVALWVANANSFGLKKLSLKEILLSIAIGAAESLLLYYLQFN